MTLMAGRQGERGAMILQAYREELIERIGRAIDFEGAIQPLPGLYLHRHSVPLERVASVVDPSVCVIAQGSKVFLLGESRYRYDPFHYLLWTVDLPNIGQILEASKEQPFLSISLSLDAGIVNSIMLEAGYAPSRKPTGVRAIDVSVLDANLLEASLRLIRLLDSPTEAPILLPLIMREMVYRLLMGEQGGRLRHLATLGGSSSPIARAVQRIRQDFDQPLHAEQLARELGMSVSGFYQHFKSVTELSPLQFQKRLRLHEARRLLFSEDLDVANAAYRVGYQDTSHFNRDYKSLFGVAPMRDVRRLREGALSEAVLQE